MLMPLSRPMLISALALLLPACATAPPATDTRDYQGRSHYQPLEAPAGSDRYTLTPGESHTAPILERNPAPVYPPGLVDLALPATTVTARLSVGDDGHVHAVYIRDNDADVAHRQAFDRAVRESTSRWLFTALTIGGKAQPFSLWFVFRFEVVDGTPKTSTSQSPAGPESLD